MSAEGSRISELWDVNDVTRRLKVRKSWIYARVHSRSLPFPFIKVGHYLRFRRQDIEDYIENGLKAT